MVVWSRFTTCPHGMIVIAGSTLLRRRYGGDDSRIAHLFPKHSLESIMDRLTNKTAVITGGSSGIGLATAQRFVDEGAYVFIVGRRQSELDKAVQQIGRNVTAVQADVSNLEDLDRLYSTIKSGRGAVDVVVASAAFV